MTPGSPEAKALGCICPGDTIDGRRVRSHRCLIHGCTCMADWRSGERVINPGCQIHGNPTPKDTR